MQSTKTWFITGASRGLGVHLAKAALRAGDRVVATARKRADISTQLGTDNDRLLSLELDVTNAERARAAIGESVKRFGVIDVLVNNAGYGHLGFFEETTSHDAEAQLATNLFGVLNVTRAALPIMRAARKGRIFNLSSLGGIVGSECGALYCASKFAVEGFSESLAREVAPFGLHVTVVEPGPFRTDFLTPTSLRFVQNEIADYDDRRTAFRNSFEQRNGQQPGDPARLAEAIVKLASEPKPPMRFLAGSIAVTTGEAKLAGMQAEIKHWRQLSLGTDGIYENQAAIAQQIGMLTGVRN